MKKTVFMINAHPDDLVASAGLAWMLVESGDYHLRVIDFSRGERGLQQKGISMEVCAAIRTQEEKTACGMLGIEPIFLHEIDGEIHASRETCQELADLISAEKPCAIFTHWPVDRHVDHVMCGAATLAALRLCSLRPEVFFHHETHQTVNMPFLRYVSFDQHIMDLKMKLIRKYVCQGGEEIAERKLCEARFFGWKAAGVHPYAEAYGSYQMPGDPSPFFDAFL
ncbi:MAG: PIG-L family deacetylase [Oligosphaeraceae bacterium]|mgnify:CR=1 FL=1|nr:PIG-L family deacetylase [Oligosphaeraceae bacterium]